MADQETERLPSGLRRTDQRAGANGPGGATAPRKLGEKPLTQFLTVGVDRFIFAVDDRPAAIGAAAGTAVRALPRSGTGAGANMHLYPTGDGDRDKSPQRGQEQQESDEETENESETEESPEPQDGEQPDSEEEQAMQQWLRRIPDDPGELLRRKFQYQAARRRFEEIQNPNLAEQEENEQIW